MKRNEEKIDDIGAVDLLDKPNATVEGRFETTAAEV